MSLVWENDVLYFSSHRTKLLDYLVRHGFHDAWVVRNLNNQERASNIVYVSDWRAHEKKVSLCLRIACPIFQKSLPVLWDRSPECYKVARSENINCDPPVFWKTSYSRESCESPEASTHDSDPFGINPVEALEKFRSVFYVLELPSSPVVMDQPLVRFPVSGATAYVERHHCYSSTQ